jgi:hypothetical protein
MSTPNDPPQSRRAARQAEVTAQDAHAAPAPPPLTRRPRGGAPADMPPAMPGDVSYRTEIRPRVPHYDAPPVDHPVIGVDGHQVLRHDARGVDANPFAAPPLVEPAVAPPASRTGEQMRRRDFRPPAEQSATAGGFAPGAVAPGVAGPGGAGPNAAWAEPRVSPPAMPTADAPLDYHTQLAPGALSSHISMPPVAPSMPSQPLETTLSRREIRELRDRVDSSGGGATGTALATDGLGAVAAPPLVSPAAFAPPANQPTTYAQPEYAQPSHAQPDSVQPGYAQPGSAQPDYAPPVAPLPSASAPPASAPVPTSTGSHWSVGIHDDDDPFENTFSREVGSAVSLSNTNALVLPEMPTGSISGPVAGTGEIIITGMIDVPRVVSSTGAVPAVHESPEIDDLFDPGDLVAGPADAAPVSALKAVSSHTSSHSVIASGKRSSSNAITTVLVASTVVMAVVAIGLFVIAAANGLF